MSAHSSCKISILFLAAACALAACAGEQSGDDPAGGAPNDPATSFEAFKHQVHYEPATATHGEFYMLDEDIAFESEAELFTYWQAFVKEGAGENDLTVSHFSTGDVVLSAADRQNVTYCVSDAFGAQKQTIVDAMRHAANAWMNVAAVRFVYVPSEDGACTITNARVWMDVQPVTNKPYVAKAPFPNQGRGSRSILINTDQIFNRQSATPAGALRHELGHVLGLRHEHEHPLNTRVAGPLCIRGLRDVRSVTACDRYSVMGYQICGGVDRGRADNWCLSPLDVQGVQALYGASTGVAGEVAPGECTLPFPAEAQGATCE
jgi:hypothetical protein